MFQKISVNVANISPVRCAGAGGCCWSGVREKHYWLAGGWRLLLEWCERKILLAGWRLLEQNKVIVSTCYHFLTNVA